VDPDDHPREGLAEPLLTATAAAALLAVRPSWVYAAVREGRLPHMRLGRDVRFLRSDLVSFVAHYRADRLPIRS
jgi:excisionase family DNA binding protein